MDPETDNASISTCILCAIDLPFNAVALHLKADSVLSFVKLLPQTRTEVEAEAELPPFSHSPHFQFCSNCHAKV
jgi:hypothetical protein